MTLAEFAARPHSGARFLMCAPDHFVDDVNVGAVHAVEVSDTQDSAAEISGNVFEFAKDLHGPALHLG